MLWWLPPRVVFPLTIALSLSLSLPLSTPRSALIQRRPPSSHSLRLRRGNRRAGLRRQRGRAPEASAWLPFFKGLVLP